MYRFTGFSAESKSVRVVHLAVWASAFEYLVKFHELWLLLMLRLSVANFLPDTTWTPLLIRSKFNIHIFTNIGYSHIAGSVQRVCPSLNVCMNPCILVHVSTISNLQLPVLYLPASSEIPAILEHWRIYRKICTVQNTWTRPVPAWRLQQQEEGNSCASPGSAPRHHGVLNSWPCTH